MPVVPLVPHLDGGSADLPTRRIRGWVRLGRAVALRQAVFDTGAPVSMLSRAVWTELHARQLIDWASHPPGRGPLEPLPTMKVMGRVLPYRVGRIAVHLVDLDARGRELSGKPTTVLCTEDDPPTPGPYRIVIGLAGALNGRSLLIQVSEDGERWVASVAEP